MINEKDLRTIIEKVMESMDEEKSGEVKKENFKSYNSPTEVTDIADEDIEDITEIDLRKQLLVEDPVNRDGYLHLKEATSSRLGISKAGARCKTQTSLRFRADHAVAMDAVFSYVSDEFLEEWGLENFSTLCQDKDEYITRPDYGRRFTDETLDKLRNEYPSNPQVQIYISDGLSSTAIETNARDTYEAIVQGLESNGVKVGKPFFVTHGRVPAMDIIGETMGADVVAVLIGERPGLATGESMSCYMAYKPTVGMSEARRTVVSNIHENGTPAVEAGAHIADVLKAMLDQKASGLDLKM